jgi:hypothetical protein
MTLDDHDLPLILAGLLELRITYLENYARCAPIDGLAAKPGGDPGVMFIGIDPTELP